MPHLCQQLLHIHSFHRAAEQLCDAACCLVLLGEGLDHVVVSVAVDDFALQQHIFYHRIQIICLYPHLRDGDHTVQQRHSFFAKLLRFQIQVAAVAPGTFQCGKHRATDTHRGIERPVVLPHNSVHALEAEAGYLAEFKGIIPQDIHAVRSEMVIDLRGRSGRDLKRSQ